MRLTILIKICIAIAYVVVAVSAGIDSKQNDLIQAIVENDVIEVDRILEIDGETEYRDRKHGYTALIWACMQGNIDIIEILLEKGAKVEAISQDGLKTPLLSAIFQSHHKVVKLLFRLRANVNSKNSRGDTPISLATYTGDLDMMKLILFQKPYLSTPTILHGYTPLHIAALQCDEKAMNLLISHGANKSIRDKNDNTPADIIAEKCPNIAVEEL